ncbi:MAG TPA: sulfatase [Bryobacteraceae bacterium]|nr:sulfatase [Bryobacteraceae bacterium]
MNTNSAASGCTRRHFLMTAATALAASAQPKPRRNVLFIASDDLNHCFSAYRHPLVHTPNLDAIARRGVRFDRSYCQFPLCSPSRTSFMTGLAPDATGVYDLRKHFRESLPDVVTLAQAFQKNDYFVARVGKIYHYGNPGQIGTDGLDDAPSWNRRINPAGVDKTKEEPLLTNYTPGRGLGSAIVFHASSAKDEDHTDGMVALETIRMMEEQQGKPWFLGAGFYKPHCPWISPSKYFDMVPLSKVKLVPFEEWEMKIAPPWAYFTNPSNWGLSEKQRVEAIRAYYAAILFLDAQVGKLLAALKRLNQEENTTVLFLSDHGYGLGEHGQWMKQTVFEYAARSPLMIAGAGIRARGKACQRTVEFLDIYPTLADLCDLKNVPARLHGKSLRPLLENPSAAWDRPAITQVQRARQGDPVRGYSMRTERYRYTMWNEGREGEELYDYSADPRELKNLTTGSGSSALKSSLKTRLQKIIASRQS